jgi:hypothetical protein
MSKGTVQPLGYQLSLKAIEPIGVSFLKFLPAGRTIASVEAWLIAPKADGSPGGTATAVAGANIAIASPETTITVGPFSAIGSWALNILATCNGAAPVPKPPLRIEFTVGWDDDG